MAKAVKSSRIKTRIEQEIEALVEAGLMSKGDAKKLLNDFVQELKTSKDRFVAFAKQELTREAKVVTKKAKPVVKRAIKNVKHARKKVAKKAAKKQTKKKAAKKKTKKKAAKTKKKAAKKRRR